MSSWLTYTGGRLCAVATRPACLFVANNYLAPRTAEGLAIVFLASALGIVLIAADPHRRYYSRLFAAEQQVNGMTFYLYAASLALMIVLGSGIVFAIGVHFTASVLIACAAMLYFASERFADEVQRIRIFERQLATWGTFAIWRSVAQLGSLGVLVLLLGQGTPAWLVASAMALANLVLFVPQLPRALLRNLRRVRLRTGLRLALRGVGLLIAGWPIWVTAQLSAGFSFIDRGIALVLDKASLPLFMLVVMCFSIVQLTVDFYYLSRHRRDFLERRVTVGAAFSNTEFRSSFFAGLALGAIACVLVLRGSRNGDEFPLMYVLVIAGLQTSVAVATIPREILYWSHRLSQILLVESVFWLIFAAVALLGWWLDLSLVQIFTLVLLGGLVRLVHYLVTAARVAPASCAVRGQ